MKRFATIAAALLVSLGLAAIVSASEPAPPPPRADEPATLTDDEYCQHWCCQRICNEKNQCYRHCWCCG